MSTNRLKNLIIESIKLLASEGNIQLAYFPDFVCKPDEIANSLGDWLELYLRRDIVPEFAFSSEELDEIIELDNEFITFSFEDFSESAVLTSPKWENIRKKAKILLCNLGIEYSLPDKNSI